MIVKPFNNPRVLYQTADDDLGIAEPAITASVDNGGLIILNQEGRDLLVNAATVPELIRMLRDLRDASSEVRNG